MLARRSFAVGLLVALTSLLVAVRRKAGAALPAERFLGARRGSTTKGLARRDHCSFVADVRVAMTNEIKSGHSNAPHVRTVNCPICRQRIAVSAQSVWIAASEG